MPAGQVQADSLEEATLTEWVGCRRLGASGQRYSQGSLPVPWALPAGLLLVGSQSALGPVSPTPSAVLGGWCGGSGSSSTGRLQYAGPHGASWSGGAGDRRQVRTQLRNLLAV